MTTTAIAGARVRPATGIAERIARVLTAAGMTANLRPVSQVEALDSSDLFVIGSAAYMPHWLRDATTFVKRDREVLAARPLWLVSSGPLEDEPVHANGTDARASMRLAYSAISVLLSMCFSGYDSQEMIHRAIRV